MQVPDASPRVVSLIWKTISTQLLFYFCTLMSLVTIHHRSLISQTTAVIACWNINLQRAHKNCGLPTRLCEHLPGAVLQWAVRGWPDARTGLLQTQQEEQCRCAGMHTHMYVHTCTRAPHKPASRVSEELSEGWRSWGLSWTLGSKPSGRVRAERASLSLGCSCDGSSW